MNLSASRVLRSQSRIAPSSLRKSRPNPVTILRPTRRRIQEAPSVGRAPEPDKIKAKNRGNHHVEPLVRQIAGVSGATAFLRATPPGQALASPPEAVTALRCILRSPRCSPSYAPAAFDTVSRTSRGTARLGPSAVSLPSTRDTTRAGRSAFKISREMVPSYLRQ